MNKTISKRSFHGYSNSSESMSGIEWTPGKIQTREAAARTMQVPVNRWVASHRVTCRTLHIIAQVRESLD